jgi:hypothetical protein
MRTLAVLATLAVSVVTPMLLVGSGALDNVIGGGNTPAPVQTERVDALGPAPVAVPRPTSRGRTDADDGARAIVSGDPIAGTAGQPAAGRRPAKPSTIPPRRTPAPSAGGTTKPPPTSGGVTPPVVTPPVVTPPVVTPPIVVTPPAVPPRIDPPQVGTPKPPLGSLPRPTVPIPPPRHPIERAAETAGAVTTTVAEAVETVTAVVPVDGTTPAPTD